MYATVIKLANGTVDGSNTDFTTPTPFIAGSARPVINGVTYDQTDEQWGCTELDSSTLRMNTAPLVGFVVQFRYAEPQVVGSPHHPTDAYT